MMFWKNAYTQHRQQHEIISTRVLNVDRSRRTITAKYIVPFGWKRTRPIKIRFNLSSPVVPELYIESVAIGYPPAYTYAFDIYTAINVLASDLSP